MSGRTPSFAADRRDWLLDMDAAGIRASCGISQQTVAAALGVSQPAVCAWETGSRAPSGPAGGAYCRVIAALAAHLAVEVPGGAFTSTPDRGQEAA